MQTMESRPRLFTARKTCNGLVQTVFANRVPAWELTAKIPGNGDAALVAVACRALAGKKPGQTITARVTQTESGNLYKIVVEVH